MYVKNQVAVAVEEVGKVVAVVVLIVIVDVKVLMIL